MPLVAHNELPTFERLKQEGQIILPSDRALHQDIRELHVGLLNMMPDAALAATERQFFRLVGESNPIAQFYMHPFTLPEIPRGATAQAHVDKHYESFDKIRREGLDALIVTGANDSLTKAELERARPAIRHSDIMVCQLEIPLEITLAAMRIAKQEGVKIILNPAPARESLPEELYRLSDIFCPNESETELLTGLPVKTVKQAEVAAASIL